MSIFHKLGTNACNLNTLSVIFVQNFIYVYIFFLFFMIMINEFFVMFALCYEGKPGKYVLSFFNWGIIDHSFIRIYLFWK